MLIEISSSIIKVSCDISFIRMGLLQCCAIWNKLNTLVVVCKVMHFRNTLHSNKIMFKWDVAIWPQCCEFSSVFRFHMLHSSFFNVLKFDLHEQPIFKKADVMCSSYFTEEREKNRLWQEINEPLNSKEPRQRLLSDVGWSLLSLSLE